MLRIFAAPQLYVMPSIINAPNKMSKTNIALSFGAVLAITGGLMAKFAIYYWLGAAGYLLLVIGVLIIMAFKDL